jgi:hypothetical protein
MDTEGSYKTSINFHQIIRPHIPRTAFFISRITVFAYKRDPTNIISFSAQNIANYRLQYSYKMWDIFYKFHSACSLFPNDLWFRNNGNRNQNLTELILSYLATAFAIQKETRIALTESITIKCSTGKYAFTGNSFVLFQCFEHTKLKIGHYKCFICKIYSLRGGQFYFSAILTLLRLCTLCTMDVPAHSNISCMSCPMLFSYTG